MGLLFRQGFSGMEIQVLVDFGEENVLTAAGPCAASPTILRHRLLAGGTASLRGSVAVLFCGCSAILIGDERRILRVVLFYVQLSGVLAVAAVAAAKWACDCVSHAGGDGVKDDGRFLEGSQRPL